MECIRGLHCDRRPAGHRTGQNPAVFHVHLPAHHGIAGDHLSGAGVLEESTPLHLGNQAKSLVLSLISNNPVGHPLPRPTLLGYCAG